MPSMKFKLLAGLHSEGSDLYRPGDVVISAVDLAARHGKDKFERIWPEQESEAKAKAGPGQPAGPTSPDAAETEQENARRFRRAASHGAVVPRIRE